MGKIAVVFVLVGIISSALSTLFLVLLVLISAFAIAIDAIWFGHFPIWSAIVAGVALQMGYVLGVFGQAPISWRRR